jgi:hypothetical protein
VRELTKNATGVDNVTTEMSDADAVRGRKVYSAEFFFFL